MSKVLAALPRILLGLVLLASGIVGLFHLASPPPQTGVGALYMSALGSTYLFSFVKLTEIAAGALLLSNRFVPLALTILAPVMLNIVAFHLFYDRGGLPMPIVLLGLEVFLAWKHRAAFAPMLQPRAAAVPAQSQNVGRFATAG